MLNRLALILDIDTDNLLEGNIAYLENDWVGILDLARFETSISVDTEVYGKPIVYIYLCYFALVGVREIYVNCGNEEEKMRRVVGDGGQYGLKILYNTEPPQESNIMVISGPVFIYGPNLTKYFQRAMSHLAKKTVLAVRKNEADMELPQKNQVNDITSGKHRYQTIPISFIRSDKSDNGIEYEPIGNGMIELEVKNTNDVLDVGSFLLLLRELKDSPLPIVIGLLRHAVFPAPALHACSAASAFCNPLRPYGKALICIQLLQSLIHVPIPPISLTDSVAVH